MLLNSITFLFLFLPVILILYHAVPWRLKNDILLFCSLFLYAWGEPVYLILLLLVILFNYCCARDLESRRRNPEAARKGMILAVTVNVLILVFFRYLGPLVGWINGILPVEIPFREIEAPFGVSVYILQAIGYVVDVYRGKIKAQRRVTNLAVYLSLFPQMAAGMVVRYSDVDKQLKERKITMVRFGDGVMYFIRGLAKTAILANAAGMVFDRIAEETGALSVMTAWLGCIMFACRIYFDLSGYSDMAIGLGQMFGFRFRKNFEYPYAAQSITEFLKKWHMSLVSWFREYVYRPLGGGEGSDARTVRNVLIVWGLTGLWYGPSFHFLFWGLYFGVLFLLEKYILGGRLIQLPPVARKVYATLLILIGWIFFFSPDMGYAARYLGMLFGIGASGLVNAQTAYLVLSNWLPILLLAVGCGPLGYELLQRVMYNMRSQKVRRVAACLVYGVMLLIAVAFVTTEPFYPFFYFN